MRGELALAVDLGGTKVEAALVDGSGRILAGSRFRRPTGPVNSSDQLAENVAAVVGAAIAKRPHGVSLAGVGIGAAGPINQEKMLASPLNLPAWRDFPIAALVADCVPNVDITLRIDGLCITLAEHWVGAARGVKNLMGLVVSTGIGGGLLLGGKANTGKSGNAGHLGHIEVSGFDALCACGGRGCLEAIASGPSTVAWAQAQGWNGSTGEDLAVSYAGGSSVARSAIERSGLAIGRAIGSATSLLDLEVVAIGGGFARVTPHLFDFIQIGLHQHSEFDFVRRVRVVPSTLSDEGPLVGAGALVHRAELLD